MPSREHLVSMSTSHEHGAVLYVVSRSGKILEPGDLSRKLVQVDHFEGELEGWIFWGSSKRSTGSSKRSTGSSGSKRGQDEFPAGSRNKDIIGNEFGSLGRISWKKRIPVVVWGDEADSLQDIFSPISWRKSKLHGRMNMARRRNAEAWKAANLVFDASLSGWFKAGQLFPSESWYSMEQNFKIGLSQLAVLQKSDVGGRWEPGTRELAAKWAAWLLKMLRRTRTHPLQHVLFTMCSTALQGICYSLVREQWTTVPDQELCRCVDIVWRALNKSHACFTPAQWEILEGKLIECRQLRMEVGSLAEKDLQGEDHMEISEGFPGRIGRQPKKGTFSPPCKSFEYSHHPLYNSRDEQLTQTLLRNEGISALVKRAVREKLLAPWSRERDGKGMPGFSSGSGTIVSLVCPLSGMRVKVPARGRGCSHPSSFDLQSFFEEHERNTSHRSSSVQRRKKSKLETGAWCCPICGSDATWPQIVVDKVLLRILEVLPEHMSQVCLLPNGRWRPVGEDSGKIDTNLTEVALHPTLKSVLNSEMYSIGEFGELMHDHCLDQEDVCGCREVQILERAYKAWKGVENHPAEGTGEQIEMQWDVDSTIAVWTHDVNSSRDSLFTRSEARTKISPSGNNAIEEVSLQAVSDEVVEVESKAIQEFHPGEGEIRILSGGKLHGVPRPLGEVTSWRDGNGGAFSQIRMGQYRARAKQMTRKT